MQLLDHAINHIRAGFHVFPGVPGEKRPAVDKPYEVMSLDEKQILRWWKENPKYNICIPMGIEIEPGVFLGAIDFDAKNANGFETEAFLSDLGLIFPETLTQITPQFGEHRLYKFTEAIGNGAGLIGPGIDHRGFHGYIMGAGSWYHGKEYSFKNSLPIVRAPAWIAEKCRKGELKKRDLSVLDAGHFDQQTAQRQSAEFLGRLGTAEQGERNHQAFQAAAGCRDYGLTKDSCFELMSTSWKHEPQMAEEELYQAVCSAYRYAKDVPGNKSPERAFTVVPPEKTPDEPMNPIDQMNKEFAFITIGSNSRILWNTTDVDGNEETRSLTVNGFHEKLLPRDIIYNGKTHQLSEVWMKSKNRRTYDGIMFEPGKESERFYNTWHGFTVGEWGENEKPSKTALKSVEIFKEHIIKNVALGNMDHANWIFCWLAHLFQKPGVKPRTALVLRGGKGIGKSAIFKCISKLLGPHYLSVAHRRYLTGNFNAHLEGKILYVLEEAFWAKDKNAEGVLKDLVTSETVQIERKGQESYPSKNLCRVVILGNEEWIVPTSEDERRYAVFDVAKTNRNDENFFAAFNEDMDHRILYDFFMGFDLSLANINKIPKTKALLKQKEFSAEPLAQWWGACIEEEAFGDVWPEMLHKETLRRLFRDEMQGQNNRGKLPDMREIGKFIKRACPSMETKRVKEGVTLGWYHVFPSLETAKKEWAAYMETDE
jgi:bifunctional DNA primase/polymerase-like protein/uncharacterized protein DUF5906